MRRAGRVLMIQGTASSVGKSVLVTGLCRLFRQEGLRVAPFKAQNMSNNSYVTAAGEELGRAQVEQAWAAGVEPDVRMNPILLKPEADHRSQVVVNGRAAFTLQGGDYQTRKTALWPVVTDALDGLRAEYDLVVIEGAGSPAEINLRAGEIVNMRVARHAEAPVLLVGDIDRGGVFAHLYGTLALLEPEERALVRGLVINKFRGDRSLLASGLTMIEERAGAPIVGVLPYLRDLGIADEDAASLDGLLPSLPAERDRIDIAVVHLPRIANFDDLDPLRAEPDVRVRLIDRPADLGKPDLIILPGTKATIADLLWLRERELAGAVLAAAQAGTAVLGVCGGYQMLGRDVRDPLHIESTEDAAPGLGLMPVSTVFEPVKATDRVAGAMRADRGLFAGCDGLPVVGYEIHMGRSTGGEPLLALDERSGRFEESSDGATDASGWVAGTYLHGLFANDALRQTMLANLARRRGVAYRPGVPLDRAAAYDRLAAVLRAELDLAAVRRMIGLEAAPWAG